VTTALVSVIGGLAGSPFPHSNIPGFSDAALLWAIYSSFTVSAGVGLLVFVVVLFLRIPGHQLARLAAAPNGLGEESVLRAREVAAAHLHAPMYIADYAKLMKVTLDDVHREVQQGRLSIFWHEGIAFVGAEGEAQPGAAAERQQPLSAPVDAR
jgi:hypothetical protein